MDLSGYTGDSSSRRRVRPVAGTYHRESDTASILSSRFDADIGAPNSQSGSDANSATSVSQSAGESLAIQPFFTDFLCRFALTKMETIRTPKTPVRRRGGPTMWGASGALIR
jgi:hypothetical protein